MTYKYSSNALWCATASFCVQTNYDGHDELRRTCALFFVRVNDRYEFH